MRPRTEIIARANPTPRGPSTRTGVWFTAGLTERGRTDKPVLLRSMADYDRHFGARVAFSSLRDALELWFREGGSEAHVVRVVGPAGTPDTVTFMDRAAVPVATIAVDSKGAGVTDFTTEVIDGATPNTFVLIIRDGGVEIERSPDLASPTAAVEWSVNSDFVNVRNLGSATAAPANNPAVTAATALVGGADDRAAILDAHRTASLARFTKDLGPGQISFPGATTTAVHAALADHARINNRFAILDTPNTAVVATLTALADALRAAAPLSTSFWFMAAPWVSMPGLVPGTTRTIPPSALVAGVMARSDAQNMVNVPAAGANGEARFALSVSQTWTDAERDTLNDEGINVLRSIFGAVRVYGYRTGVDPAGAEAAWLAASNARLRMDIVNRAEIIAEEYLFAQLDGQNLKISEFGNSLSGLLNGYYDAGALYGESPDDAYSVDVGPGVNTPPRLAANQLRAVMALRMSPFAEAVFIEIVKVAITEPV